MGRHLNCGGDFGAERRCFGELSKKQDDNMDNLKGSEVSPRRPRKKEEGRRKREEGGSGVSPRRLGGHTPRNAHFAGVHAAETGAGAGLLTAGRLHICTLAH